MAVIRVDIRLHSHFDGQATPKETKDGGGNGGAAETTVTQDRERRTCSSKLAVIAQNRMTAQPDGKRTLPSVPVALDSRLQFHEVSRSFSKFVSRRERKTK